MKFKLDDQSLRVGRRKVKEGMHIRVIRAGLDISGTFLGIVPSNLSANRVREREPRVIIQDKPCMVEYVALNDISRVEILERNHGT